MQAIFEPFDPNDCILKPCRIDIWQYPLHISFENANRLLSTDEQARAQRYHFIRHQHRFTVARAMLRIILSRYLIQPPANISLNYNQHGKPQLTNNNALEFNLSHSCDMAILAIGKKFPLGIDLEFFSARPYLGIGKHLFSAQENIGLTQIDPKLKPLAFFHIWAQKEAFIKACGLGLTYPTQQFNVPILPNTNQPILDPLHQTTRQLVSFMPEVSCCAALCHDPAINQIRYLKLPKAGNL